MREVLVPSSAHLMADHGAIRVPEDQPGTNLVVLLKEVQLFAQLMVAFLALQLPKIIQIGLLQKQCCRSAAASGAFHPAPIRAGYIEQFDARGLISCYSPHAARHTGQ